METHIFKQYFGVHTLSKTSKRMTLPIDYKHRSTQFLTCTAVFLCREFKLENICSGVKLILRENVCMKFFLQQLIFADH